MVVRRLRSLTAAAILAWLGLWFHDLREFAGTFGLTPDVLVFVVLFAGLVWFARAQPSRRWPVAALFGVGVLQLVGGIVSVLPLGFLPYLPAQTAAHYWSHAAYAAAQIPLLLITGRPLLGL